MQYEKFSEKQLTTLLWWETPKYSDKDAIICDGSVRSGKTLAVTVGFVLWSMTQFDGQLFAICGKTIESLRRNVIIPMQTWLRGVVTIREKRGQNCVEINYGGATNRYFLFGGRDESSYQLIQGITLAGVMMDEVALMPRSFVEQALARCSVPGSKFWFNCNPEHPNHWFYKEWILEAETKNALHVHYTMDDNPSLGSKERQRYETIYSGIFYERYVQGLWHSAEGLIYKKFATNPETFLEDAEEYVKQPGKRPMAVYTGVDWGNSISANAHVALIVTNGYREVVVVGEFYSKDEYDPEGIYKEHLRFMRDIQARYGPMETNCDEPLMTVRGLKNSAQAAGIRASVHRCTKYEIIERIRLVLSLFSQKRIKIDRSCVHLIDAFKEAVWAKGVDDKRLDDGTSNIDSLDAFEYAICNIMEQLERAGRIKGE